MCSRYAPPIPKKALTYEYSKSAKTVVPEKQLFNAS